jgi:hypothetical protein
LPPCVCLRLRPPPRFKNTHGVRPGTAHRGIACIRHINNAWRQRQAKAEAARQIRNTICLDARRRRRNTKVNVAVSRRPDLSPFSSASALAMAYLPAEPEMVSTDAEPHSLPRRFNGIRLFPDLPGPSGTGLGIAFVHQGGVHPPLAPSQCLAKAIQRHGRTRASQI